MKIELRNSTLPSFKSFAIHPVKYLPDGNVQKCQSAEANFYGVYAVSPEGHEHWLADLETLSEAATFTNFLTSVCYGHLH